MTSLSNDWLINHQERINLNLKSLFAKQANSQIKKVCEYAVLNGGKRIRALVVYAISENLKVDLKKSDNLAMALELIHAYSLIHDDLPAMDNDDLRRGKPTCHIKFGEDQAILAGDALQTLAFQIISNNTFDVIDQFKIKIIQTLSNSIGIDGMVLGQSLDMLYTNQKISQQKLIEMQSLKTGKLFEATFVSSYYLSEENDLDQMNFYQDLGSQFGRLYQIIDDILDLTSDTQTLGKTSGKDAINMKTTFLSESGLGKAQQEAKKIYRSIKEKLSSDSQEQERLNLLADVIYNRDH